MARGDESGPGEASSMLAAKLRASAASRQAKKRESQESAQSAASQASHRAASSAIAQEVSGLSMAADDNDSGDEHDGVDDRHPMGSPTVVRKAPDTKIAGDADANENRDAASYRGEDQGKQERDGSDARQQQGSAGPAEPRTPRASTSALPGPETMSPSQGARSLIDPDDMIVNPFGVDGLKLAKARGSTSSQIKSPRTNGLRLSAAGEASHDRDLISPERTPSTTQESHFSTVALGDTPNASPRIGTNDLPASAEGKGSASSAFVSRHMARLSTEDGARRQSLRAPDERLQERFNELRMESHSRTNSTSRRPKSKGRNSTGEEDNVDPSLRAGMEQVDEMREDKSEVASQAESSEAGRDIGAIDWDFWGQVMSDYQDIARTQPQKLSQAIQTGIPSALRGMLWQLMSSSKDEEMEIIYQYYLKQTSPHEKMIRKDISRTFPHQDYFQASSSGPESLFNIMKAYSLLDEEVGYCQGMQFVVGPLLLNMPEEETFSTLVRLMRSYDLRGHFVPNMPALQLRLFQFERLLEEFLPLLHRHLVRAGVKTSMYASGWLMTLFCYRSPLAICYRILDSVFAEGIEALFRFALALMQKNEEQLLTMEFDEAVPLLAGRVFEVYRMDESEVEGNDDELSTESALRGEEGAPAGHAHHEGAYYRVSEFVRDAFEFKITPFMLDSYASDFAEQVRAATAHRREVEELKVENRSLQAKVKSLEDQLGALQTEHVDLVKSVVMAKLAEEEMAEELMKYKMMYAEAALLVDQSGVSGDGLTSISLHEQGSGHSSHSSNNGNSHHPHNLPSPTSHSSQHSLPSPGLHLSRASSQHSWR